MARDTVVTLFPETQAFAERDPGARAALSVRHLTKSFGAEQVLDNVSFSVAEGESLVLLGPSGSGKSTTLRLIAGLEAPDGGEIAVRGQRVEQLRARARNVGVIFQNYALFPRMTVADNIGFGLRIRGQKRQPRAEVVARLLALIGLADQRDKYPGQLSGGQQQRVAIARALAYEPDVLLFDESFSALDPQTRVGLRREIRALLRELRVPALFITHDQDEAMELGDHIAILNRGRLEQVGSPAEVYNDPQTVFVATFLGAANVLDGQWRRGAIRFGADRHLPAPGHTPAEADGTPTKLVFRPEDVVLDSVPGPLDAHYYLGRGEVVECFFAGASETLTVRLGDVAIKALRIKWDTHRLPLGPGDLVSIGLKTYKLLKE
jgi:ABC-type Fe3+/spermidine/putrescine transport system ATPase subunit